ncbi:MarR family winged helix-turn-helix transcriptional regulator [Mucilaginibacter ginsenosidivorans]|uniref:HTH marR-type domain-containing protein n=1 Tax=Mucilaginibacter ginsenosidivorans TaxID=398053 RepID=A0A5B8URE7_9SPHI|nr:hypothetical protein [Mucilaginibacter ginsenosidivorans]QEC61657.1 hypothetical protein FRZ54_03350 [Mucilaginibacter ginsenosidivorans]
MHSLQLLSQNLRRISKLYSRLLSCEIPVFESDACFAAILILSAQKAPVTQNKLAELLKVDKSRIVHLLLTLNKAQLVDIEVNPDDRRQHYVSLSARGREMAPLISQKVMHIDQLSKNGISNHDLSLFYEVTQKIEQNLAACIDEKSLKSLSPNV